MISCSSNWTGWLGRYGVLILLFLLIASPFLFMGMTSITDSRFRKLTKLPEPEPTSKTISVDALQALNVWQPEYLLDPVSLRREILNFFSYYPRPSRVNAANFVPYEQFVKSSQGLSVGLTFYRQGGLYPIVEAVSVKQEPAGEWKNLTQRMRFNYSDYTSGPSKAVYASEVYSYTFPGVISMGPNETIIFMIPSIGEFDVYTTLDAGQTWHLWRPSSEWKNIDYAPYLQEYEMKPNGMGRLVYRNHYFERSPKAYVFKSSDKGITWQLTETLE